MPLQSNIEQFVENSLKKFRNANEKRAVRPFIEKAIKQIDFFLDATCCENPEDSIEFSRRNNAITNYISAIFSNQFDKRKYRKSLLRTKKLLQSFLDPFCCIEGEEIAPGPHNED